jgi:hypothetical protein
MPEAGTRIHFTNHLSDRSVAENQIRLLGSGVALGDVDGDGLADIYLCRLEGANALYRNLGNWKFEEVTTNAGVACADQYSTGAALVDLDGDRDLDLLVNSLASGTRCFLNDGKGRFTESNSGLMRKLCATSMALADIDGNGTLDLYVANYRTTTIRSTGLQVLNVNGRRVLRPEDRESYEITPEGLILEHAEPDAFYLNDGKGNFTPVSWNDGRFMGANGRPLTRGDKDWGLSVIMRDMNSDGTPDIYVCNDFWSEDAIWINDGKGRFKALPQLAMRNSSTFSMGVDFADINRDGLDDFVVLDMRSREHERRMVQRSMLGSTPAMTKIEDRPQTERNTLFLNRGDGTFAEMAQFAGLQASEWSWCAAFLDVDLDGYEDLLVTTGHGFDTQDIDAEMEISRRRLPNEKTGDRVLRYPRLHVPNQAFRNRGDLTFEPAGDRWGFNTVGVSHGMALADLDGDGDLDAVVNDLNGAAGIYRNEAGAPRVAVRLKGKAPNTAGIGAKIKLIGGVVTQAQEMVSGGRYLSSDDAQRTFAAWNATNHFNLEVRWRSGAISVVTNLPANSVCEVEEAGAVTPLPRVPDVPLSPLFSDESDHVHFFHREEAFDDFARQPLLSKRLSQSGPGLAWVDLDEDNRDDLIVTSGRGHVPGIFINKGGGAFEPMKPPTNHLAMNGDQTAVVSARTAEGVEVFIAQANDESAETNAAAVVRWLAETNSFESKQSLMVPSTPGPLALSDIDADGDLDLFVGGRMNPGRYPEPATSRLFRKDGAEFVLAQDFSGVGLVNGAVFTDLNGDGFADLVLACEWGPLKVFRNDRGSFSPWTISLRSAAATTLDALHGWWQGVTAGDFDGDGRMDIVASNWGRNSPYQPFMQDGIRIYYGDFSGAGWVDGIEAFVEHGRVMPWRDLQTLSRALPWLQQRFTSHHVFARASIAEVLVDRMSQAKELRVNWVDSTVFLNRGDHFEVRSLAVEAQFAPAFGICAADFNGDGHQDLFLAQNFFGTDGETSRYDAGRGLLLQGDGRGEFRPVRGPESGVLIYGEQRGAAVCDYDGDGRLDLAVGQHQAEVKLHRNQTSSPGLRVRLRGGPGNRDGIGAVIRRGDESRLGPAYQLHAGAGYCSQDSATTVIAGTGDRIWVRWPGGKETTARVPVGAKELVIEQAAAR